MVVVGTVVSLLNLGPWGKYEFGLKSKYVVISVSCLGFIAIHSRPLIRVISCD